MTESCEGKLSGKNKALNGFVSHQKARISKETLQDREGRSSEEFYHKCMQIIHLIKNVNFQ